MIDHRIPYDRIVNYVIPMYQDLSIVKSSLIDNFSGFLYRLFEDGIFKRLINNKIYFPFKNPCQLFF
jgi:hypothetical protein